MCFSRLFKVKKDDATLVAGRSRRLSILADADDFRAFFAMPVWLIFLAWPLDLVEDKLADLTFWRIFVNYLALNYNVVEPDFRPSISEKSAMNMQNIANPGDHFEKIGVFAVTCANL